MKQGNGPRISFRGKIFYGGSKTVKTYLVNVIACETIKSTHFLVLATNEFVMKFLHQIETLVKSKYHPSCQRHRKYPSQPLIIFINEIDTLFKTSVNEVESNSCIKTEFLLQMLGNDPLIVLGSTNISWALTSAIRRKFAKRNNKPLDVCVDYIRLAMCSIHLNNSSHTFINQNFKKLKRTTKPNPASDSAFDFSVVVQKSYLKDLRNKYTFLPVPTFFLTAHKLEAEATIEAKCRRYGCARRLYQHALQSYMDCNRFENENNIYGTDFLNKIFEKHFLRTVELWEKMSIHCKIRKQSTGKRIPFRGVLFFGRLRIIRAYLTNVIGRETIKSTYFVVSSYDFVSKWLNELEEKVKPKIRMAPNCHDKPLILWIDEIDTDSIDESDYECCFKTEFLIKICTYDMNAVFVIGATKIILALASAIRQQLGKRYALASKVADAIAIFKMHFDDNSSHTMLHDTIKTMSKSTDVYTASDNGDNLVLVKKLPNKQICK